MSSGTQKASNVWHPYLRILFPFMKLYGNYLNGLDQVGRDRVLEAELPLQPFKILTPMLDQKLGRMGFVGAVGHVAVKLRRPGHEGVAHVLRHALVLLQGLEKKNLKIEKCF